ncbi:uncharacterized [Tachysurus ichikawai]
MKQEMALCRIHHVCMCMVCMKGAEVSRVLNSNFLVSGDLELLGTESNNERIPPQIESTILRQPEGERFFNFFQAEPVQPKSRTYSVCITDCTLRTSVLG